MPSSPARPRLAASAARRVYDVIVLGGQLGGALAAALLAKRGHRVLLVEHDGMGHGYTHGDYLLPYSPFLSPSPRTIPAFDDALTELGLNTTVQRALRSQSPELQLVLKDSRIDLHSDAARRKAELTRELGDAAAPVEERLKSAAAQFEDTTPFFKAHPPLPPRNWLESWKLKRVALQAPALQQGSSLNATLPALPVLRDLSWFVQYLNTFSTPLGEVRPLSQVLASPGKYPGGREWLRELICKKLVDLGGEWLWRDSAESSIAEELVFEGGKLVGVKLLQSDNEYRASCVVVATDAGAIRRLIPDKKHHRKLTEQLDWVETRRFLFTLNWVLPADRLPKGMGEVVVLETGDEALGTMLIQVLPARTAQGKDEDSLRTICAGAFVPASARELGEDHLKGLVEKMEAQLDHLMPFSKRHLLLSSAPYLHAGGVRGSRLLPHPLIEVDTQPLLGVAGLPLRTPVKNLFLASREVLPGLGLEGEVLAGVRAVQAVQHSLHKSDPLKRPLGRL